MPTEPDTATGEGKRLIERWEQAKKGLEYAKSQVNSAECELANATNALAKWMLPEDAAPGEKICVWHLDALIQVEASKDGMHDAIVTIRKRGREYQRYRAA